MIYEKQIKVLRLLGLPTMALICSSINLAIQASPQLKAQHAKLDLSQSKPLTGNVAACKPLEGGVKLSVTMPPAPADLRKGAIFKEENIPKTPKVTDWYLIPSWMAGEWHRETVTEIFPIEILGNLLGWNNTHLERADHTWGHQVDRLGGIWQHRLEPYTQLVEMSDINSTKTVTLQKPVLVSDSKVIIHYKDISVNFNKRGIITRTYQHEQISELTRQGDLLFEDIHDKNFDDDGICTNEGHSKTTYTLIKRFSPIDQDKRTKFDLKQDFRLYLKVHGYTDRIPLDLAQTK